MEGQVIQTTIGINVALQTGQIDLHFPYRFKIVQMCEIAQKLCQETNAAVWVSLDEIKEVYRVTNFSLPNVPLVVHVEPPNPTETPSEDTMTMLGPLEDTTRTPRPPNMWILYRREKSAELRRKNPSLTAGEISTLAATMWKNEDPKVRAEWKQRAGEWAEVHRTAHQDTPYILEPQGQPKPKWEEWGWLDENGELLPDDQRPPRPLGRSPFGSYGL